MSLTGNLCVDKCNEGEFNEINHCASGCNSKCYIKSNE